MWKKYSILWNKTEENRRKEKEISHLRRSYVNPAKIHPPTQFCPERSSPRKSTRLKVFSCQYRISTQFLCRYRSCGICRSKPTRPKTLMQYTCQGFSKGLKGHKDRQSIFSKLSDSPASHWHKLRAYLQFVWRPLTHQEDLCCGVVRCAVLWCGVVCFGGVGWVEQRVHSGNTFLPHTPRRGVQTVQYDKLDKFHQKI